MEEEGEKRGREDERKRKGGREEKREEKGRQGEEGGGETEGGYEKVFSLLKVQHQMSSNCSLWEVRTGAVSSLTYTHTVITRSFTVVCGRRRRVRVRVGGG